MKRRASGLFIVAFLAFFALFPELGMGKEWRLSELVRISIEKSPEVKRALLASEMALVKKKEALSYYFPTLDLSGELVFLDNPPSAIIPGLPGPVPISEKNLQRYRLEMNYVVFDFGRRKGANKIASIGEKLSGESERLTREEKAFSVARAVVDLLRARSLSRVASEALEMAKEHARVAEAFYEEGVIPKTGLLEAEVSVKEAERRLLSAKNRVELAFARLMVELGTELPGDEFRVEDLPQVELAGGMDEDLKVALARRSEISLKELAKKMSEEERKLATTEIFPVVFLNSSVSYESNELNPYRRVYAGVVGVKWNLFSGFRDVQKRRLAALEAEQLKTDKRKVRDLISLEVKDAYLKFVEAREQLKVAEAAVEKARENFRMTSERFKEGEATSSDVIDAQFLLTRSMTEEENARFDLILAGFRRLRARGEFLEWVLGR